MVVPLVAPSLNLLKPPLLPLGVILFFFFLFLFLFSAPVVGGLRCTSLVYPFLVRTLGPLAAIVRSIGAVGRVKGMHWDRGRLIMALTSLISPFRPYIYLYSIQYIPIYTRIL